MELNKGLKNDLTTKIRKKSIEIGFDLVGITSAEPFVETFQLLQSRKLSEFVNQDKRLLTEPGLHLKDARSIIALALSYASSQVFPDDSLFIALYARGRDYHLVMKEKMSFLEEYLKSLLPGVKTIAYSDTGPILDREVAKRAGLGWIGKSNNLINPEYGSYLFLGEIITNLELEYDKEMENRCGNCTLCLQNCPGGALVEPYLIDHQRCISYLTQKKGLLTRVERKRINLNLWGCDTCLRVCPYNQDVPVDLHPEFNPEINPDPEMILNSTRNNLNIKWKNTALSWRGLRILKRNTLINIGNSGDKKYIPLLLQQINSKSPPIRAYAIWALGELDIDKAKSIINDIKKNEREAIVINEINALLKK
jgi:epoxyqueuosine reductase